MTSSENLMRRVFATRAANARRCDMATRLGTRADERQGQHTWSQEPRKGDRALATPLQKVLVKVKVLVAVKMLMALLVKIPDVQYLYEQLEF